MLFAGVGGYAALAADIFAVLLIVYLLFTINWPVLRRRAGTHHFFAGAVIVLCGFWLMRAGVRPGLHFHILGMTALTLLMGWRLALLACAFVITVMVLMGRLALEDTGVSFVLGCVVPVAAIYQFYLQVYRRMAHNPFIYILVAGFLNAMLSQAVYALTLSGWYVLTDVWTLAIAWHDFLSYLPLMMFPEGVINGMFIAGMVSFHPRWLSTFDQDSYFG